MIELEIRTVSSPDIEFWGEVPCVNDIYFLVQIEIGERGDDRQDLFQVMVATPEALRSRATGGAVLLVDRATLVVNELSWKTLMQELGRIVEVCCGSDWNESVLKLQRYLRWEYEDYDQPDHA